MGLERAHSEPNTVHNYAFTAHAIGVDQEKKRMHHKYNTANDYRLP